MLAEKRPKFRDIRSFEEFNQYYWYREELSQICKSLKIENKGTKQELNNTIREYFEGNYIKESITQRTSKNVDNITTDTPLLECGFSFNTKFREYSSILTGVSPSKFTADIATLGEKLEIQREKKHIAEKY